MLFEVTDILQQTSFNMSLLIVWHLTKVVPRPEFLPSITLMHLLILWLYLGLCVHNWAIIMASKDPKLSKQGTAGKRKHTTSTIPQKLEITTKCESNKRWSQFKASYNLVLSTGYDIRKETGQLQSLIALSDVVKDVSDRQWENLN